VYEDVRDAANALKHLHGFNVQKRFLVVLYYQFRKTQKKLEREKKQKEHEEIRKMYGLTEESEEKEE
jgi:pre-mRNA branch site protein p14